MRRSLHPIVSLPLFFRKYCWRISHVSGTVCSPEDIGMNELVSLTSLS